VLRLRCCKGDCAGAGAEVQAGRDRKKFNSGVRVTIDDQDLALFG